MSDNHDNDAVDFSSTSSPGELLRRERETQGLSVEEVATALNLRPAVVVGLEADNYEQVPIAAYRRGYLRAYARLLGIDDGPILAAYRHSFGGQETEHRVTPVQVTRPPSRIAAWLFKLVTLLVIAGLIGLTLAWWQSRDGTQAPELGDSGPVSVERLDGTTVVEEEPAAEIQEALPPLPAEGVDPLRTDAADAEAPATEVDPTGAVRLVGAGEPALQDEAELDGAVVEAAPEPEAPAAEEAAEPDEAPAATADRSVLQLTFNEQSWTEIFDANNRRVFVGLQEPGTSARVEGEPPFRLTIGNATGVELSWGGERVDLRARAGANNVARFTLGD
ncbi:RodZ domain-containing protein [Halomonas sp. E19]|uniref:RodZ domain-containing protein n=1 Tax=unclassified Halomonas TaxID=2609666 RepID=UPI0040339F07